MEIEFTKGFEYVCDNWQCWMYRRVQATKLKEPKPILEAVGYQVRHDIGITTRKAESLQTSLALQWRHDDE
jgi:hypothetical protein